MRESRGNMKRKMGIFFSWCVFIFRVISPLCNLLSLPEARACNKAQSHIMSNLMKLGESQKKVDHNPVLQGFHSYTISRMFINQIRSIAKATSGLLSVNRMPPAEHHGPVLATYLGTALIIWNISNGNAVCLQQ